MTEFTYKQAGVDIHEGARAVDAIKACVRATYTSEVIGDLGGFGALFSAAACKEMDDPILVSGTDGVGTKLELAKRLGDHSTVGIDLVAMCVNDIVTCGARPLFFLDYLSIGKLEAAFAAEVVSGIAQGCILAGCALIGGEMAEHPGVMQAEDYDLSGFAVGVVDRAQMLGPARVCAGDVIIGLASSGLHSNGYSLVRRAFTGQLSNEELQSITLPAPDGRSLGKALLAPTRIYVQRLLDLCENFGADIHAAAHITGGGITENLNRALPQGLDAHVTLKSWPLPPVIKAVADAAALSENELLKTFNAGIGMTIIVAQDAADAACAELGSDAYVIGTVRQKDDPTAPGCVLYEEA
jgi:phosphoribosylformylglycinamidine cyclo-ligase